MIKLKDILLEGKPPSIFIPRRIEDRVERMIALYVRNGSKGNLSLSGLNLTKLPDILKDISVGGSFYCYSNKLTSLENCPKTVGGNFNCSINELTSLKGAPTSIGISFYCSNNKLTSLEFTPTNVGRDFHCNDNPVKFTEEQVRAVCDVKGKVYV
jgi:hypothetical protein